MFVDVSVWECHWCAQVSRAHASVCVIRAHASVYASVWMHAHYGKIHTNRSSMKYIVIMRRHAVHSTNVQISVQLHPCLQVHVLLTLWSPVKWQNCPRRLGQAHGVNTRDLPDCLYTHTHTHLHIHICVCIITCRYQLSKWMSAKLSDKMGFWGQGFPCVRGVLVAPFPEKILK